MSQTESSADRVWALIDEIQIAMVVTHDGHGDHLRARPMAGGAGRREGLEDGNVRGAETRRRLVAVAPKRENDGARKARKRAIALPLSKLDRFTSNA